ncbi:hypothetical protein UNDYM_1626 [Undibacterium sp. YM2]|uniref:hypothetical protein n=1 Tax=Undibacterium sp. YM2 TaxID=2058625 RepID=UPI001331ED24|nr:hypothetical protein [Undibacterium sp. YM2]BBB65879.1 hypothetical protein UNDYM_1626 [Undibacterium sp. YM2]
MSKKSRAKHHCARRNWNVKPAGTYLFLNPALNTQSVNTNVELDVSQQQDIRMHAWQSYAAIASGSISTIDNWAMVTTSMNIALLLAEYGYGVEHQDVFVRAQEALTRCYIRGTTKHVWRFDGAGVNDVRDALELHDQQCALVTHSDIAKALREIAQRVAEGNVFEVEAIAA